MKKETVIRQNRCDQELSTLLYGCFFGFIAMQLFAGAAGQLRIVNAMNMALYFIYVPGFIFYLGYQFHRIYRQKTEAEGKNWLRREAMKYGVGYFVLAMAQKVIWLKEPKKSSFSNVITFVDIPTIASIFLAMTILLLVAAAGYSFFGKLADSPKKLMIAAVLCLACALLASKGQAYALMSALVGARDVQSVPFLPYMMYFFFGIWIEKNKPAFQWKLAVGSVVLTIAAAVLYRTSLQNLSRVLISVFPVYIVYVVSELLFEVTLRVRAARFVCEKIEPVFAVCTAILFFLCASGKVQNAGIKKTVILAAGVVALVYVGILLFFLLTRWYDRFESFWREKIKHKTAAYFLLYTIVFAFLLFLTFSDFLRFDKTLLWKADTVSQYYPRAVYYANSIRDFFSQLLHGNYTLPMYDFRLGMGGEITYSLEPLYVLFAVFGADKVEFTYTLLILLRFYLAGVSFSVLGLYFKKDYTSTFIASCVYVFCGFSLFGGARHTMFMIQMIFLPLLIIAVEEILRNKRWYLCTIFVALSLFSNYYFLYMSTIGMGVYFLVRFFCEKDSKKKTVRNFFADGLIISGSYLLGVAMSCIVLVTTFGLYVGSGRSGSAIIKTPSLFYYGKDWLVRCLLCFITTPNSPGDWLKLGFLPITLLAVVLLFARKGRRELKWLSAGARVFMAFPLFGFLFNGFSSVSNRWCYMIALLAAYIVADCLPQLRNMSRKEIGITGAAVLVYGYLVYYGNYLTTMYTQFAFWMLLVTFVVLMLCQENRKWRRSAKQLMLLALTVVMVYQNAHMLYSIGGTVDEYTAPGQAQELAENTPIRAMEEVEDDSFYRVSTPKLNYSTISSSIILDYNSISMFNSTFNGSISEYLERMGSTGYSVTQLFGLSNRAFLNSLAAVKYYTYYDDPKRPLPYGYQEIKTTEVEGQTTTICENEYAMPLGYTYDSVISKEELEAYDTLERQEVMMQSVMLDEDLLPEKSRSEFTEEKEVQVTLQPMELQAVEEAGIHYNGTSLSGVEDAEKNSITLQFASQPNSEVYLVLKNAVLHGNMSEKALNLVFKTENGSLSYKFRPDDDRYGTGQEDYVFNLGYFAEPITSCSISMDWAGTIEFDKMELCSQPMDNLEQYTGALRENVLENEAIEMNQVSGTISLEQDKILVLSIPYQKGWKAYVDGEETQILRANYMYMAIPLEAGTHEIRLTFEIPGVKYALVIMPSAVVLFIGLLLAGKIKKRITAGKKKTAQSDSQE